MLFQLYFNMDIRIDITVGQSLGLSCILQELTFKCYAHLWYIHRHETLYSHIAYLYYSLLLENVLFFNIHVLR